MGVEPIMFRKGRRVYLRPVLRDDLPTFTVWMNDSEITQYLKAFLPYSNEDEVDWFENLRKRRDTDHVLAMVLIEKDELIGTTALHKINYRNGTATTGTFIGRKDCWGKGYGTEAKMLMLDYAFNTLNLRKINSTVLEFNGRSKRCLEKTGYREEGRLRQQVYKNGCYVDEILMAVFREDFAQLQDEFWKD